MLRRMTATVKAFSIGGIGSQISLDDLVRISCAHSPLVLDPSGAERVKKLSPPPKQFQVEPSLPENATIAGGEEAFLSPIQSRAILAARLVTLMNGRSGVRLAVCDHLMQLLNQNSTPTFPSSLNSDKEALTVVANACYSPTSSAPDAPPPPQLSPLERASIQGGSSATAGIAALSIHGAKKLLSACTSVLALSVEAVGCQAKAFDTDLLEAQNFKSAISVADELRTLLEGSKRVGTVKGLGCEEMLSFSLAAQVIGAAVKATGAAYDAIRSEVQSEALPPSIPRTGGDYSPQPSSVEMPPTLIEMSRTLLEAGQHSLSRASKASSLLPSGYESLPRVMEATEHAMRQAQEKTMLASSYLFLENVPSATSPSPTPHPGLKAAFALSSALEALRGTLMIEAFVAIAVLKHVDEATAAAAAVVASSSGPMPMAEDGIATPEPKKSKESKKGPQSGPVVLGKGTTVIRSWLSSYTRQKVRDRPLSLSSWSSHCSPTDLPPHHDDNDNHDHVVTHAAND